MMQMIGPNLINCASLFSTIAGEHAVAGHACRSVLVDSPSALSRVGVEDTAGHIAPVVVLEQPSSSTPNPIVGEGAVLH